LSERAKVPSELLYLFDEEGLDGYQSSELKVHSLTSWSSNGQGQKANFSDFYGSGPTPTNLAFAAIFSINFHILVDCLLPAGTD